MKVRRVRISIELVKATKFIQKKLANILAEFSSLNSAQAKSATLLTIDIMLASSDEEETHTTAQAAQKKDFDVSRIPHFQLSSPKNV